MCTNFGSKKEFAAMEVLKKKSCNHFKCDLKHFLALVSALSTTNQKNFSFSGLAEKREPA